MGHIVQLEPVKQAYSNWCWAACCEMFAKFHGYKNVNQYAYVTKVYGNIPPPTASFESTSQYNSAAEPGQFLKYLQEGIPTAKSKMYVSTLKSKAESDTERFTKRAIKGFIDANRIMIFGTRSHAMVLVGYAEVESVEKLVAMDPQHAKTVQVSWTDFDTTAWVVYKPKTA